MHRRPDVVSLSQGLFSELMGGRVSSLHSVAITSKLNRSNLLDPTTPSRWPLSRCRKRIDEPTPMLDWLGQQATDIKFLSAQMLDPHLIIRWLDASRHIKDAGKIAEASVLGG